MFGRKQTDRSRPPRELLPADTREALAQLDALAARRQELATLARLHSELVATLFMDDATELVVPGAIAAASSDSLELPLLRVVPPTLDDESLRARCLLVCEILARHRDPEAPRTLAEAIESNAVDPSALLLEVLRAGHECIERGRVADPTAAAPLAGVEHSLIGSVLRLSALPALSRIVAGIDLARRRPGWSKGTCPVCGSWPLLAEFRGLEQLRWFRCGLCAAGWQADRLFCPYCENRDHRQLQDLFVEGPEAQKHRVTVCDACRGFVRGVATLAPLSPPGLLVAELETLHLELAARERGYHSGEITR